MTKRLEEVFDINPTPKETPPEAEETQTVIESKEMIEIVNNEMELTDKIDASLPMVQDLNEHDRDMDEIHGKAIDTFERLVDIGMNVEAHAGAKYLESATQMLKTAMEAKDSKVDRKLKMLNLQLNKAKLDLAIEKEAKNKTAGDDEHESEGSVVVDRNELMKRLSKAQQKIDETDK